MTKYVVKISLWNPKRLMRRLHKKSLWATFWHTLCMYVQLLKFKRRCYTTVKHPVSVLAVQDI